MRQILRRRATATSLIRRLSSADDRSTFSTVWQSVDTNRHDGELVTPDPIEYLSGFDLAPTTSTYRAALLRACAVERGQRVLDVGCGLGRSTVALAEAVGGGGTVDAIDISEDAVAAARAAGVPEHANLQVGDIFALPFADDTFDCVLEDRVLQHLNRPLEAVKEMLRVAKPGARVVCGNPDWRTFHIDVTGAGGYGEAGARWGEDRRPAGDLGFDLAALTTRLLGGVIPTLTRHSYLGLAQPRLLRAAGLEGVELASLALPLRGRHELESVVPITYFARLAANNGGVTAREAELWLARLAWARTAESRTHPIKESLLDAMLQIPVRSAHSQCATELVHPCVLQEGDDALLGTLCMHVACGRKPATRAGGSQHSGGRGSSCSSSSSSSNSSSGRSSPSAIRTRRLDPATDAGRAAEVATLINEAYAISDTGVTLASPRLALSDVEGMLARGELLVAEACEESADDDAGGKRRALAGVVQVEIKGEGVNAGLPTATAGGEDESGGGGGGGVGEFSCLAVRAFDGTDGPPTLRGVGAALVRAAEAHCRARGCAVLQMGILCPAAAPEPAYKQWLQRWYLRLGYEHRETLTLRFEPDEVHEMYACLRQKVPCKYILFDKRL